MKAPTVLALTRSDAPWSRQLEARLGSEAPSRLWAIGNLEILAEHKVGLFCSVRCPGNAIIAAHDAARKLREDGTTVISGFQSPVEKECLRILLGGKQPVIICLARALGRIRLPAEWRKALDSGRLLILSPFEKWPPRPTVDSAWQRNQLVATLSDEVLIIHATPGGQIYQLLELVARWRIPQRKLISRDFDRANSEDKI
ncbi:MAG: DNA-processing protein DprA [Candidatus Binatia bacterium]